MSFYGGLQLILTVIFYYLCEHLETCRIYTMCSSTQYLIQNVSNSISIKLAGLDICYNSTPLLMALVTILSFETHKKWFVWLNRY